jgi:hypothetical protein
MKITLFLLAAVSQLSAQTAPTTEATSATTPPQHNPAPSASTYMMITPSARALDFQQAFESLRAEKSAGKLYFELADGSTIGNIIDMQLMSNSTLALFRYTSTQGIRYQVVKVEDLRNLRY